MFRELERGRRADVTVLGPFTRANIGVTPKEFARGARLRRALTLSSTSTSWLRVALDAGYYDHAHLIADFRDLVGLTPIAFAKRRSEPNPQPSQ